MFRSDTAVTRENSGTHQSHDTPPRRAERALPTPAQQHAAAPLARRGRRPSIRGTRRRAPGPRLPRRRRADSAQIRARRSGVARAARTGTAGLHVVAQPHRAGQQVGLRASRRRPHRPRTSRVADARRARGLGHGRCQAGVGSAGRTVPTCSTGGRRGGTGALRGPATTAGRNRRDLRRATPTGRRELTRLRGAPAAHRGELSGLVRGAATAGGRRVLEPRRTREQGAGGPWPRPPERRTGPDDRTGGGLPTSPGSPARGASRQPRWRGGVPGAAGWPGRSRPSPRHRRGRRAPRPGTSRRHRAASREVRLPTTFRPDRPRPPGVDW